jgi:hypothetical protein
MLSQTTATTTHASTPVQAPVLKVKTRVKAGLSGVNHNETLVKAVPKGLKVKTKIKAGGVMLNHNETLVRAQPPTTGLTVKTRVKAGLSGSNHNETLVRAQG